MGTRRVNLGLQKIEMNKVVYNSSYGYFNLSEEAEEWLKKHGCTSYERHSPLLVRCVEELGEKASGPYSRLKIKEITGDKYIIDDYDGKEKVLEPSDIKWIQIKY